MPAMTSSAAEEHAVTIMLHANVEGRLTRTRSVVIAVSTLVLAELPTAG